MQSLINSHEQSVYCTYVIYLAGHAISEASAKRCLKSCDEHQQLAKLWPAVDGTSDSILIPEHLRGQGWIKWLKLYDHHQSRSEVAVTLSHMSLWAHCMEIDRPIVVLEHDAVMIKRFEKHRFYNAVQFLGCREQLDAALDSPPMIYNTINQNWWFMNRAHAYSIDPAVARRLFSMVLERGIFESLDVMMHIDAIAVIQDGVYAYDYPDSISTIGRRKKDSDHGPGLIRI